LSNCGVCWAVDLMESCENCALNCAGRSFLNLARVVDNVTRWQVFTRVWRSIHYLTIINKQLTRWKQITSNDDDNYQQHYKSFSIIIRLTDSEDIRYLLAPGHGINSPRVMASPHELAPKTSTSYDAGINLPKIKFAIEIEVIRRVFIHEVMQKLWGMTNCAKACECDERWIVVVR
jgi:hypothetical protein